MASPTAAALPVSKTGSVCIPNAHLRRGSDATVSRDINLIPELRFELQPQSTDPSIGPAAEATRHAKPGCAVDHYLGGVNVTGAKASDEGTQPMFQLLAQASGAITPALLAKHHLPAILLQHGPLAIRHITAHLIASLPGFSTIPPAKQRRVVVGALEGRGGSSGVMGEVGGVEGDVIFEKVGWGRWDARRKGDPPRERPSAPISPPLSATRFEKDGLLSSYPRDAPEMQHSNSYTGESGIFVQSEEDTHDEDVDMEDGDDGMSLDEDSSVVSEDDDMTDEEDWAQMGPAALRRQGGSPITSDGWGSNVNSYAKSPALGFGAPWNGRLTSGFFATDEQRAREEREAVEALVKLSSV